MVEFRPEGVPAFDAPELEELKRTLVTGCHILDREGITDGYGHLSVRVPGAEAFLTIARVSPRLASLERLIMLDFEGRYLGGAPTPPFEWPIHARILRARPDVASVCHTHSLWSVLFSVLPIKLRPLTHYETFLPAEGLPLYEPAGLVRTVEQGDALAAALGTGPAVLLRSHGDAVVGGSIQEAVQRTIRLARAGQLAHLALLHGQPRYLSAEDLQAFEAGVRDAARGWEYYVSRLPASQ
ncbi:MAG TPA: class II aldolase/adducin family protein [Chloroflexota bacterium]|jgi:ribulose-5-phosphate 4-epimerase/fuculose-1-phosphate aldolase|nr:class II aldolase/adducin family protein [Chloroflexota bacterium]HZU06986.1 class II aldolase/adducin family protein [Chloroflexota bacterium]